jgi:hypothetical protein
MAKSNLTAGLKALLHPDGTSHSIAPGKKHLPAQTLDCLAQSPN